jgi:hypothetical protein
MDDARFDALAKTLGTTHSRRRLARLVGGLSLGGVLSALAVGEAVAALRRGGSPCTRNRQCKTGACVGPAGNKKCRCSRTFPACKQPTNPCQRAACDFATKRCVIRTKANGAACGTDRACCRGACVDTSSDPRNCGSCGHRCQVNAICSAGTCTCVRGACPASDATCCPTSATRADVCRCTGATNLGTCETAGNVEACLPGTVACLGPRCAACCPAGSTCDPSTGTCLRQ